MVLPPKNVRRSSLQPPGATISLNSRALADHTLALGRAAVGPFTVAVQDEIYEAKCRDLSLPITDRQHARFIAGFIDAATPPTLDLRGGGYGMSAISVMTRVLNGTNAYTHVYLGGNFIKDEGLVNVSEWLANDSVIQELDVRSVGATSLGVASLARSLTGHASLRTLDLGAVEGRPRNRLGLQGAQALTSLLINHACKISTLRLSSVGVSDQVLAVLSHGFAINKSLRSLDLSANGITSEAAPVLCEALSKSTVTELNLDSNSLGPDGLAALALSLLPTHELTALSLAHNGVGAAGAAQLSRVLSLMPAAEFNSRLAQWGSSERRRKRNAQRLEETVPKVSVELFDPGDIGSAVKKEGSAQLLLGDAISSTEEPAPELPIGGLCALQRLDLSDNDLGDAGAVHLADGLASNTTLTALRLGNNKIGANGAQRLAAALTQLSVLEDLDLSHNVVGDAGAGAVADALRARQRVHKLDLSANGVGDEGAQKIASSLLVSTAVTHIRLRDNIIDTPGIVALSDAVKASPNLVVCDIGLNRADFGAVKTIEHFVARNIASMRASSEARLTARLTNLRAELQELERVEERTQAEQETQADMELRVRSATTDLVTAHVDARNAVARLRAAIDAANNDATTNDQEYKVVSAEYAKVRAAAEQRVRHLQARAQVDENQARGAHRRLETLRTEYAAWRADCADIGRLLSLQEVQRQVAVAEDEAELLELEVKAWEEATAAAAKSKKNKGKGKK